MSAQIITTFFSGLRTLSLHIQLSTLPNQLSTGGCRELPGQVRVVRVPGLQREGVSPQVCVNCAHERGYNDQLQPLAEHPNTAWQKREAHLTHDKSPTLDNRYRCFSINHRYASRVSLFDRSGAAIAERFTCCSTALPTERGAATGR